MYRAVHILAILIFTLLGCKTEFEQVRTSNDPNLMLATADKYYEDGEYNRAIVLYELLVPAFRGKAEAEGLYFNFANAQFKNGNYILASHYFKTFSDTYTGSPMREMAMYHIALSEFMQSPRFQLDQSNSSKSIDAFQAFINNYPESEWVSEANEYMDELRSKMETKAFESGKLYYNLKNYSSAIQNLENMLKDFPGSDKSEEALYLIVKASKDWADNSIYTRQQERYTETKDRCLLFEKKYPQSEQLEDIRKINTQCQKAINNLTNG